MGKKKISITIDANTYVYLKKEGMSRSAFFNQAFDAFQNGDFKFKMGEQR